MNDQLMILAKFMQTAVSALETAIWADDPAGVRESCADLAGYIRDMEDLLNHDAENRI